MQRITKQQALDLYQTASLHELGRRAAAVCEALHPGPDRSYIIERNINYTNICRCRCSFCAFSVPPRPVASRESDKKFKVQSSKFKVKDSSLQSPASSLQPVTQSKIQNPKSKIESYVLTEAEIIEKVTVLRSLGGNQVLWQGGINPDLRLAWHESTLRNLKARFPGLHLHGYSPPEINFMADLEDLPVAAVLARLRAAGLDSIPGGGAEILVDRVRRLIAPAKGSADAWLAVMGSAHRLGLCTTATMMFGHVETLADRIEHLDRLRTLQDESLARRQTDPAAGSFTAFTCWPFQPGQTRLGRKLNCGLRIADCGLETANCQSTISPKYNDLPIRPPDFTSGASNPQSTIRNPQSFAPAEAFEYLKMTALARIYLDNFPNIQASWVTQGPHVAQLSLALGCNDLGSLMIEENVVAAAGTAFSLQLQQLQELIRTAGFTPRPRNFYYHFLGYL